MRRAFGLSFERTEQIRADVKLFGKAFMGFSGEQNRGRDAQHNTDSAGDHQAGRAELRHCRRVRACRWSLLAPRVHY